MKLTRNLLIGLAAMLAGVNLAASQERPKRLAAPKLPAKKAGVEVMLVVVKGNGHGGPGFSSPENCKLSRTSSPSTSSRAGPREMLRRTLRQKAMVLITISKQTTYITEPLRKDGYVNYVAALNQRFGTGVTPKNNAAVSFLKAMGPGEIGPKYRDEYWRLLDIPPLPEKGDYYVKLDKYEHKGRMRRSPLRRASKGTTLTRSNWSRP